MSIKRKAVMVVPTRCRQCSHQWYDKYYEDERTHKVICPKCQLVNAELDIHDCIEKVCMQAIRYDIGMQGQLGGSHFSKSGMIRMLKKVYGEKEARIKFWEMMDEAKDLAMQNKLIPKKPATITIKRKGEKDIELGEKLSDA